MMNDIHEYWKRKFWENIKKSDIPAIRAVFDEGYLSPMRLPEGLQIIMRNKNVYIW